jgi:hypothetical protein
VAGKSGCIPDHLAPILERLHINPKSWLQTIANFDQLFGRAVGRVESLARRTAASGRAWIPAVSAIAATRSPSRSRQLCSNDHSLCAS